MKISIIIPCHNAEQFLAETLRSVQAQTTTAWEAILVDDGSKDGTAAVMEALASHDSRIKLIQQKNQGVSSARNSGFLQTSPDFEYVAFLDSDDLWEPDALESLQAALASNPKAVAANGLHRVIDKDGQFLQDAPGVPYELDRWGIQGDRLVPCPQEAPTCFAVLVYKNYIMTPGTLLIRRCALEKLQEKEIFDPAITHGEDWDVWLRLALIGDITAVQKNVLRYRRHSSGASASKRQIYLGEHEVREKLLASPELTEDQKRMVRFGARFAERDRSRDMLRWAGENARRGKLPSAARQLRHAALGYMRYLRGQFRRYL